MASKSSFKVDTEMKVKPNLKVESKDGASSEVVSNTAHGSALQAISQFSDLSDDCLIAIFQFLTDPGDAASSRLVCRRWHELCSQGLRSLQLQRSRHINHTQFLTFLRSFSHITKLVLPKGCLDLSDEADEESMAVPWHCGVKSDSVIYSIGINCSWLTHLEVDFHQKPDFAAAALKRVFQGCRDLEFLILGNRQLLFIPESVENLLKLRKLQLNMPHLRLFPNSLSTLPNLTSLAIHESVWLQELGGSIGRLNNLKVLELKDVKPSLPDELWLLTGLERLCLEKVWLGPDKQCSIFGRLSRLKSLELKMDPEISLPRILDFGDLPELLKLDVSGFSPLINFSALLFRHPVLEELALRNFKFESQLPDLFHALTSLHSLCLTFSPSRDSPVSSPWPSSLRMLTRLRGLEIANHKVTVKKDNLASLSSLKELRLRDVLFDFVESVDTGSTKVSLGFLKDLDVLELEDGYGCFETPPDFLRELSSLSNIRLSSPVMKMLPGFLNLQTSLEKLELNAKVVQQLPESFLRLRALEELSLAHMRSLTSLPLGFGQLRALQVLKIHFCVLLNALPESLTSISGLKYLEIYRCGLQSLPQSMGDLQSLRDLQIAHCPKLGLVPDSICKLRSLRLLLLEEIPSSCVLPLSLFGQNSFKVVLKGSGPRPNNTRRRSFFDKLVRRPR